MKTKLKKKTKDKEYHPLVDVDTGTTVFEECLGENEKGERPELQPMTMIREGKPLPKDSKLYISEESSPGHVKFKEVRLDEGPIKVNSESYREGWDRIFSGAGGMEN